MKTFVSAAALFCAAASLTGCTAGQQVALVCGLQKGLADNVNDFAWRHGNYSSAIDGMIDADVEEDQCIDKAVALDMPPPEPVLPWPVCNKVEDQAWHNCVVTPATTPAETYPGAATATLPASLQATLATMKPAP